MLVHDPWPGWVRMHVFITQASYLNRNNNFLYITSRGNRTGR